MTAFQASMTKVIKGVGGLSHRDFRQFSNERKTVACSGFIDGDLIEALLEPRAHLKGGLSYAACHMQPAACNL